MNCKNCGAPLNETDRFCQNCGMVINTPVTMENNQPNLEAMTTPNIMPNQVENQPTVTNMTNGESIDILNTTPTEETKVEPVNEAPINMVDPFQQATMSTPQQEPTNPFQTTSTTTSTVNPIQQINETPTNNMVDPFQTMNNTNNFNYQPLNENKKNGNMIVIIMGVVIVILLGIVAFLALNTNKAQETKNPSTNNGNSQTTTPTNVRNTTQVVFNGYTFEVPSEYRYQMDTNALAFGNDNKVAYLYIEENMRLSQLDMLGTKANLETLGATVSTPKKEQYDDVNMVVYEAELSGEKVLVAFADLGSNAVVQITIQNLSNEFDYDTLKNDAAPMVKSAKQQTASNSIAKNDMFNHPKSFIQKNK